MAWLGASLAVLGLNSCGAENRPIPGDREVPHRTIALNDGSTLEVPEWAERILPVTSAAVDLLADLDLAPRVVAVPRAAFSWSTVGQGQGPFSEHPILEILEGEAILAHKPDLILAAAWSNKEALWVAHSVNIPVVILPEADTWEHIEEGIRLTGEILAVEGQAQALVESLRLRKAKLARSDLKDHQLVTYSNFGAGGHTSGTGTSMDLVIRLAGMRNAVREKGHGSLSLERILALSPDVFVTATGRDDVSPGAAFLLHEPALAGLAAIQAKRIAVLPAELFSSASHRILDAAEELARQVAEFYP